MARSSPGAQMPEDGDLIIRRLESATTVCVIRAVPGPDQLACATLAEAERVARSYAEHARVNLWLAQSRSAFTLLSLARRPVSPTSGRQHVTRTPARVFTIEQPRSAATR